MVALAGLATIGNIILAIIRRNSGAKVAAVEKVAKAAQAKAQETAARLDAFDAKTGEHKVRIDDIDERISTPSPSSRQLEQRLSALERAHEAERETREARRETQHKQEVELAIQLTRMGENVKTLAQQVEKLHR